MALLVGKFAKPQICRYEQINVHLLVQCISLHLLCPHNKIKFKLSWLYKDSTSISCLRMFIAVFEILHRFILIPNYSLQKCAINIHSLKLNMAMKYSNSEIVSGGYITQCLNFLQLGQDIFMWNKGLTRKYSTFWYYNSLLLFLLLYMPCFTRVVKQGNFPQFLSLIS